MPLRSCFIVWDLHDRDYVKDERMLYSMLDIEALLRKMTLEEKAGLCSGADQWHTKEIKRLGIPALRLSDGPHGLRFIEDGKAKPAVCFPTGSALASSFDKKLIERVGEALGRQARKIGVHTLLGPAVNMKRSPLCGRNFEYFSEDPYLAGVLGAAMVEGIQSQGVGACPKHFAANNQEYRRMSVSAQVDEQALREIYLSAFETIVNQAAPRAIMCAYNRVNGVYASENAWLLNKVLREDWGYDGIVMTDWAAMAERPKALTAGLELEMPSSFGENDRRIVAAVKKGTLKIEVLDEAVRRLLRWIERVTERAGKADETYEEETSQALARRAAGQCAVLLKNNGVLPLQKDAKIAFIGGFAAKPRFQGGGSSNVNALGSRSALQAAWDSGITSITYAEGFNTVDDIVDDALHVQAVQAAAAADIAVIFAGLPNAFEAEGRDRESLSIPENQNRLIEDVCAVQPNTVVVFHAGSPVVMPWRDKVAAILYMYLGGQCVGEAEIDLLFGDVNPSGKLAETFPLRLEDTPCWLDFPGVEDEVQYSEGVYIGYRWYQKRAIPVQWPFGFGLSYTTFEYSNLHLSAESIQDIDILTVHIDVTNTGARAGSETIQLYVAPLGKRRQPRPLRELKSFEKVTLRPGETKTVTMRLDKRSFAFYSKRLSGWYVESGPFAIQIGPSSENLPLQAVVTVEGTDKLPVVYTDHMTVQDLRESGLDVTDAMKVIGVRQVDLGAVGLAGTDPREVHLETVRNGMPIHATVSIGRRDMPALYDALRRIEGLGGKENIPCWETRDEI